MRDHLKGFRYVSPQLVSLARLASPLGLAWACLVWNLAGSIAAEQPVEKPAAGAVTFNKHIAPLLFERCAGCHRPGEVAPFSLLTYRDVSKRAEQIQNVTEQHIMPPWKPVTGHGEFSNGRRLTAEEIALIKKWVDGGVVEGQAADLPQSPKFASGWQLGPPDLVVTMSEPVEVPAAGRDVYQNVLLPLEVPLGKYIKAAEFRPSNRRVVHHAVLFYDTSGKSRERDAADPAPGFSAVTPPGRFLPGTLAIWTPGRNPLPLPSGLSMPWPRNADLVLNLHLHPSGKGESEQSSIGFYFTDEPPQRSLLDVALIDTNIDIAPGDKAFRTKDNCVLPIDMELLSIFPHMHMIGKDMKVTATFPDGTMRPLLWIDDWNFNWQDMYEYSKPVHLPKGTKLVMEGMHDNSADNPFNPKNPPDRVRWGEQTFNEMSIAFLNLTASQESDMSQLAGQPQAKGLRGVRVAIVPDSTKVAVTDAPSSKPLGDADYARLAAEGLRKADKDGDGKLSLDEIVAAVKTRASREELAKHVTRFDRDGDNLLNVAEVAEAMKVLTKK
jgi:mono/diheme cytochrome c family protein